MFLLLVMLLSCLGPGLTVFAEEISMNEETEITEITVPAEEVPETEETETPAEPEVPAETEEPSGEEAETEPEEESAPAEEAPAPEEEEQESAEEEVAEETDPEEKPAAEETTESELPEEEPAADTEPEAEKRAEEPATEKPVETDPVYPEKDPSVPVHIGDYFNEEFFADPRYPNYVFMELHGTDGSVTVTNQFGETSTYRLIRKGLLDYTGPDGRKWELNINAYQFIIAGGAIGDKIHISVNGNAENFTIGGANLTGTTDYDLTINKKFEYAYLQFSGIERPVIQHLPSGGTVSTNAMFTYDAPSKPPEGTLTGTATIVYKDGYDGGNETFLFRVQVECGQWFSGLIEVQCYSPTLHGPDPGYSGPCKLIPCDCNQGHNTASSQCYQFNMDQNAGQGLQNLVTDHIIIRWPANGKLKLTKSSANTTITNGNACYSLAGTEFEVKDSSGKVVGTIKVKADGSSNTLTDLPAGTYTVTETKAGKGYILPTGSAATKTVKVEADKTATVSFTNQPANDPQRIQIQKIDPVSNEPMAEGAGSFQGAQFTLKYWDNNKRSGDPKMTLVYETDANGRIRFSNKNQILSGTPYTTSSGSVVFPLGWYTLEETKAPEGYKLQTNPAKATVNADSSASGGAKWTWDEGITQNVIINATPTDTTFKQAEAIYGGFRLLKVDADTTDGLKGATFSVFNGGTEDIVFEGETVEPDGVVLEVTTDENGLVEVTNLPYGTYYVKETEAPTGFQLNDRWTGNFTVENDGDMMDFTEVAITNTLMRGDLHFLKNDKDGSPLANIPFWIIHFDDEGNELERHVIVSDANGMVDTSAESRAHTNNTNGLDQFVEGGVFTDSSKLDSTVGVWFSKVSADGSTSDPNDDAGALPLGSYRIVEIKVSDAEKDYNMLQSPVIALEEESVNVEFPTMQNLEVEMTSDALNPANETKMIPQGEETTVTVKDTITYTSLTAEGEYRIYAEFVLKSTPDKVLATAEEEITPESAEGEVELSADIDITGLEGETIAVIGYLYQTIDGNEVLISTHNDELDDLNEELYLPKIGTTASDSQTNDHVGTVDEKASIVDVIAYEGLQPGQSYKAVGSLHDAETGDQIGEEVEQEFTTDSSKGTVTMPAFEFDGTEVEGKSVVVFENIYLLKDGEELLVGSHEAQDDENQTVTFAKLQTNASDGETGTHTGIVGKEVTIVDTVTYSGLIPEKEYVIKGTLMNKETEKPILVDGKKVEATVTLAAGEHEAEGSVDLVYKLNSMDLRGEAVVVFEDLYYKEIKVASHAEITDEGQTVEYPDIKTKAVDRATTGKFLTKGKRVQIEDTVTYKNLDVNATYVVRGTLMDKKTGKPVEINGKKVTAESEPFQPESKDGETTVVFELDSSKLEDVSLVVFETLYEIVADEEGNETERKIVVHEDINDVDQTLYVPKIRTKATDKDGKKVIMVNPKVTLVDTVSYTNIAPGKYTLRAELYFDNGKPVNDNHGKPYVAEITFEDEGDGEAMVSITIDATNFAGKKIVFYETLLYEGNPVAEHKDPRDKDQTVEFTDVPNTGDNQMIYTAFSTMVLSLDGILLLLKAKKKREEEYEANNM